MQKYKKTQLIDLIIEYEEEIKKLKEANAILLNSSSSNNKTLEYITKRIKLSKINKEQYILEFNRLTNS